MLHESAKLKIKTPRNTPLPNVSELWRFKEILLFLEFKELLDSLEQ